MEPTSLEPQINSSQRIERLRDRSFMMHEVRQFFKKRHVMEVDCPILSPFPSIDAHIDLITAEVGPHPHFLHTSPEYGMKRLLSEGSGDIFQMSHVFRKGEKGQRHNPEFTLIEWYRVGYRFQEMIKETADLIRLFFGPVPLRQITYRQAIEEYTGLDYTSCDVEALRQFLVASGKCDHESLVFADKDDLLNLILAIFVEPQLGRNGLCALTHFPASQAALAKCTEIDGERVAERFEIYCQGWELCNGYHELASSCEQRLRFEEANQRRLQLGKERLPIDEEFLSALDSLPCCCGVAVGFDRLMMLRHSVEHISEVLTLPT